ncbi:MAG: hypothetical protein ACR5K9_08435 [Wolbachia sp.]
MHEKSIDFVNARFYINFLGLPFQCLLPFLSSQCGQLLLSSK